MGHRFGTKYYQMTLKIFRWIFLSLVTFSLRCFQWRYSGNKCKLYVKWKMLNRNIFRASVCVCGRCFFCCLLCWPDSDFDSHSMHEKSVRHTAVAGRIFSFMLVVWLHHHQHWFNMMGRLIVQESYVSHLAMITDFKRFQVCSKCAYHIFVLYFIL